MLIVNLSQIIFHLLHDWSQVSSSKYSLPFPGTPDEDTVCQICSDGTFSEVSSAHHNCTEHKSCSGAGLQLALRGSSWHNNVCANCEDLKGEMSSLKRQKDAYEFIKSEKKQRKKIWKWRWFYGCLCQLLASDHRLGFWLSEGVKQLCSNSFFLPPGAVPVNTINSFIFISQGVEITYNHNCALV